MRDQRWEELQVTVKEDAKGLLVDAPEIHLEQ